MNTLTITFALSLAFSAAQTSPIRSVDFNNFTYPEICCEGFPVGGMPVRADGQWRMSMIGSH